MKRDIIILGAGPTGLMAALELVKKGRSVTILEARDRIGGRAYTLATADGNRFESGAEFVHGNLPITLSLLKEAGLGYTATAGAWVQVKGGQTDEEDDDPHWPEFMHKLNGLDEDMSLQAFLEEYFPGERYAALKDQAIAYAEGYDSADAARASAKALYLEWSAEQEEQYRIDAGYSALMEYLAARCRAAGCEIRLGQEATSIKASEAGVEVITNHETFLADWLVAALPLGVLQTKQSVLLSDAPSAYRQAIARLGMGDVIKLVFYFDEAFWQQQYPGLGFLMSGAEVPTWWTQAPAKSNVLTGWMPGRMAKSRAHLTEAQLRDMGLRTLAQIFSLDVSDLEAKLLEAHTFNWSGDPFTCGAYAYMAVGAEEALQMLAQPMAGRVYFAGEYMYSGTAMGTVEAAFWSGRAAANRLLEGLR